MFIKSQYNRSFFIWPIVIVVIFLIGCDSQLPQAYQDKDFPVLPLDNQAIQTMTDSQSESIMLASIEGTFGSKENIDALLRTASFETVLDSLLEADVLDTLKINSHLSMAYADTNSRNETDYAYFVSTDSQKVIFYTTWQLLDKSKNASVDIDLLKKNGTAIEKNAVMPLETIIAFTDTVIASDGTELIIPKIRTRIEFGVAQDEYLVKLTISEPKTIEPIQATLLQE